MNGILISLGEQEPLIRNKVAFLFCLKQIMYEVGTKIQQTKMLVTCQRFDDLFLFRLVCQYSLVQTKHNNNNNNNHHHLLLLSKALFQAY